MHKIHEIKEPKNLKVQRKKAVVHFISSFIKVFPFLQSKMVNFNKKLWMKKLKEKQGKQNFKIVTGHNIFYSIFIK